MTSDRTAQKVPGPHTWKCPKISGLVLGILYNKDHSPLGFIVLETPLGPKPFEAEPKGTCSTRCWGPKSCAPPKIRALIYILNVKG